VSLSLFACDLFFALSFGLDYISNETPLACGEGLVLSMELSGRERGPYMGIPLRETPMGIRRNLKGFWRSPKNNSVSMRVYISIILTLSYL
jgi:hypothetical protein